MSKIVVIDYHKGNLSSVARGIAMAQGSCVVSDAPQSIQEASGLVLPGVGSFEDAMSYMNASGQADAIRDAIAKGVPFLGICLGLQVLFSCGTETSDPHAQQATVAGLGVFDGIADKLVSRRLKVPHVGWDQLDFTQKATSCPLLCGIPNGSTMYFTHSYAVSQAPDEIVVARTHYTSSFASVVWSDHVYGCQFHPEKSSSAGLKLLSNFVDIVKKHKRV